MTIDLESLRGIRRRMSEIVQGTHDTRSEALVDLRELHSWGHTIDSELTARRARDAEVEALVAAGSELISAFDGPDGYGRACKLHLAVESTRSALAPFTGDKT